MEPPLRQPVVPGPEEDGDLVRRVRSGDARAFETLYLKYRPAVFKMAHGITGNLEDALDVTQETFLKAHGSFELFEGRASILTWLCQIAIHRAIDTERRKKVRRSVELQDYMGPGCARSADGLARPVAPDPQALACGNELRAALAHALSGLSEKHRTVFMLYTVKGLSYKEIARALGISVGTVMSRLFYARKNLQGLLAEFASASEGPVTPRAAG
jgi:RNA polymerase sigma-70 factor (ECF subfamily)